MTRFKKILKKPVFWVGTVVIIVILLIVFFGSGGPGKYDYSKAEKGELTQEVSVTGDVQPIEGVNLAFEKSGRIKRVAVGVGEEVYRGESLIYLEAGDLYADLEEAKANLEAEEAKLAELKRGPTTYELKVKRAKLKEAEQDLENDYGDVTATVQNAYSQSDDAVRTRTVGMFRDYGSGYVLEYNACDSSAENLANFGRSKSEELLENWRDNLDSLDENSSRTELIQALESAKANLLEVNRFLGYVGDTLSTGCELSDASVSSYRSKISTARDNINAALSSVNTLRQSISSEKSTVDRIESELEELEAGASEEELAVQKAVVRRASAKVDNVRSKIEKTILRAPFSGEVTKIDGEIGEIVDAYNPMVSVISRSGFKIEANIPEVDVAKVEVGDEAEVTLDAYGDSEVFKAKLISLDSAETVVEGISTYGATLEFKKPDERIRSGMTANVDIITGRREDVVYIPQRAVIEEEGKTFVRVLEEGEIEKREVVLGMEDSMGNVEVKEGIKEGEKVVVFINGE